MTWKRKKRKKRKYGKRVQYSVIAKLQDEGKLGEQFCINLNQLSLEDLIAVKLELAAKSSGGNIYGIPIWYSIVDITRDACLRFALSATRTKMEAARFLGMHVSNFDMYIKKYGIKPYFVDREPEPLKLFEKLEKIPLDPQ